jgi:hypothetical protein
VVKFVIKVAVPTFVITRCNAGFISMSNIFLLVFISQENTIWNSNYDN